MKFLIEIVCRIMGRRILNDALRTIVNAEKRGFASAELKPISNVVASFLQIMKYRGMQMYVNHINNFLIVCVCDARFENLDF